MNIPQNSSFINNWENYLILFFKKGFWGKEGVRVHEITNFMEKQQHCYITTTMDVLFNKYLLSTSSVLGKSHGAYILGGFFTTLLFHKHRYNL